MLSRAQAERLALALVYWNHHAEHALHGHRVATGAPIAKEMTVTVPCSRVKRRRVCIVLTTEGRFKPRELYSLWLLGILLGLGDLPDHT